MEVDNEIIYEVAEPRGFLLGCPAPGWAVLKRIGSRAVFRVIQLAQVAKPLCNLRLGQLRRKKTLGVALRLVCK